MKMYKVLIVFSYCDKYVYCFDDMKTLCNYINSVCDTDDSFLIETRWLSQEMIKDLKIDYIRTT